MKRHAAIAVLTCVCISVVSAAAPGPPRNLAANVSGNSVILAWQAPASGDAASGYLVEAALAPGGAAIAALPVSATTLTVDAVPNGIYYVRVRGVNVDGSGPVSNEVIVVVPGGTGGCTSPPNAPTNVASTVNGTLVTLTWSPPIGGCPITGYIVQAGSGPGLSNLAVVNAGTAPTLSANAGPGTYYVRVIAVNAFGASAATSDIVITVGATTPTDRVRVGAVCRDGTTSTATGSGACSNHGGVSCWLYNDGTCTNPDMREPDAVADAVTWSVTPDRGSVALASRGELHLASQTAQRDLRVASTQGS